MSDERIVIVGAGPVGLAAALALARRGVPVTVVEAEPALTIDLRAGSYHPPTIEMLEALGVGGEVHAIGIKVPVWQIRDRTDGIVAEFDLNVLAGDTPHPYRLHCEQHRLTPILLRHLRAVPGAEIRFGAPVAGAAQHADGVTVTFDPACGQPPLRGRWLIGADGARSVVRRAMDVAFEGFTWPERFLVASTTYDMAQHGYREASYVADPEHWAAIFKMPDDGPPGLWRIAVPTDPEVPEAVVLGDALIEERLQIVQPIGHAYPLKYRSTYRVHQRVATSFRTGRMILAGDAAHLNNPLGGLGLNGGIHDAMNLAEKLVAIWHGRGSPALLDLYDRQRRPVNVEFVQATSIRNKRMIEERDPAVRRAHQDELRRIVADRASARAYMLNSSMIASVRKAATIQ